MVSTQVLEIIFSARQFHEIWKIAKLFAAVIIVNDERKTEMVRKLFIWPFAESQHCHELLLQAAVFIDNPY